MPFPSDAELDALLLAQVTDQWQKVAMVIAKTRMPHSQDEEEKTTERITALVRSGKLESQGDIRSWRTSEIRLPQKQRGAAAPINSGI